MLLKNKINQRLTDSSNWILNSPESLVILLLMGTGLGFLAFGSFSVAMGFSKYWFFMILFGVFSFFSLKKFIDIFKMVKKLGIKNALGGFTANEFIWKKDKYGKKIIDGGVKDGNSRYENNEGSNKYNEKRDGKIGQEVRDIYRQSK